MKANRKENLAKALNAMPETVRVGPWKFTVMTAESEDGERQAWGECDFDRHWITIFDCGSMSGGRMLAGTVLHEILHGIWRTQGLPEDIEEAVVSHLETGLLQLIADNPKLIRWLLTTVKNDA